jgi:hypothetical protein
MKQKINILTILLFSAIIISCGQAKKQSDKSNQNSNVHNYTKVISDSTNKLTEKIENLEVQYTVWGCACPQWIKTNDTIQQNNEKTNYIDYHFYLEPADKTLELPIYFDAFRHILKIKGQFYEKEDYPQGTVEMEEPMSKARVFRYSKIEVIDNPNFKADSKFETLTLIYNAISCTCAQWSDTRKTEKTNRKQNYWLEPANEKLINADTLFNGENLPIIIKVTGQVVTEIGFPKRELAKVGKEEEGKVFRYTKIEIIQNGKNKNGS